MNNLIWFEFNLLGYTIFPYILLNLEAIMHTTDIDILLSDFYFPTDHKEWFQSHIQNLAFHSCLSPNSLPKLL